MPDLRSRREAPEGVGMPCPHCQKAKAEFDSLASARFWTAVDVLARSNLDHLNGRHAPADAPDRDDPETHEEDERS